MGENNWISSSSIPPPSFFLWSVLYHSPLGTSLAVWCSPGKMPSTRSSPRSIASAVRQQVDGSNYSGSKMEGAYQQWRYLSSYIWYVGWLDQSLAQRIQHREKHETKASLQVGFMNLQFRTYSIPIQTTFKFYFQCEMVWFHNGRGGISYFFFQFKWYLSAFYIYILFVYHSDIWISFI